MRGRWLQVPGDISGYIQDRVMGLGLDLPINTTSTIIGMKFLTLTQHHQETSDRCCRYTTIYQKTINIDDHQYIAIYIAHLWRGQASMGETRVRWKGSSPIP